MTVTFFRLTVSSFLLNLVTIFFTQSSSHYLESMKLTLVDITITFTVAAMSFASAIEKLTDAVDFLEMVARKEEGGEHSCTILN